MSFNPVCFCHFAGGGDISAAFSDVAEVIRELSCIM